MSYLNIERTTIAYEKAYSLCKLLQLETDAKLGDTFGEYILSNTGNPIILKDEELINLDKYFKKGLYVNLFPLKYVDTMVSDIDGLAIKGFSIYEDRKVFHPLKGFDENGNEIADLDKTKEKAMCRYYYINNQTK